jgi:hypothetical protein
MKAIWNPNATWTSADPLQQTVLTDVNFKAAFNRLLNIPSARLRIEVARPDIPHKQKDILTGDLGGETGVKEIY